MTLKLEVGSVGYMLINVKGHPASDVWPTEMGARLGCKDKGVNATNLQVIPVLVHAIAQALAEPNADGWIDWHGGDNPAPGKTVEFRMRAYPEEINKPAPSSALRWGYPDMPFDIIAYRILQGEAEKSSEAPADAVAVGAASEASPPSRSPGGEETAPINWRTLKPGDRGTITLGFEVFATDNGTYANLLAEKIDMLSLSYHSLDDAVIHLTPPVEKGFSPGDRVHFGPGAHGEGTVLAIHETLAWVTWDGDETTTEKLASLRRAS